jgi:hypothetical protein
MHLDWPMISAPFVLVSLIKAFQAIATHVTRNNTPIHSTLSTAPQLNISQKALGTLPENGNVMP